MIHPNVTATVGRTALVELGRLAKGLAELKRFFLDYKILEEKDVEIEALRWHEDAESMIADVVQLYFARVRELR